MDDLVKELYPRGLEERTTKATSPYPYLIEMILEDKGDLLTIVIFTFFSGLFSLSIPLATQIVVNTVAAGVFLQPLIVVAGGVFLGLTFVAVMRLLTLYIVEQIRQRTFARVALRLAYRVPQIRHSALADRYPQELVNRFFDTITVQSGWFNFLLDAPAAALQVVVGLVLLAVYSPWLMVFDVIVILFFLLEVFALGFGGYKTRSAETTQRFVIAEWLEQLAHCETGIKTHGAPPYFVKRVDKLLADYVRLRRRHFGVLFRQSLGLFFFQSCASAGVLGFGAFLVVHRELTMGQLVASLLIVNMVLPGLERVVRNMQNIFELLSALGKIGFVEDLPLERSGGYTIPPQTQGAKVEVRDLSFGYKPGAAVLKGMTFSLVPGDRISLFGPNGSGKTTLAKIMCGLLDSTGGMVLINGMDIRDLSLSSLRSAVSFINDANEILPGTILENIEMGRTDVTHAEVLWALDVVNFADELTSLPNGLHTELISGGKNLSRGQSQKLLIARAIVKRPQLLIMDEAFTAIEERTKVSILDKMYDDSLPWTIIDMSHDADTILRSNRIIVMDSGVVVESGTKEELIKIAKGKLAQLFPQLVQILRSLELTDH